MSKFSYCTVVSFTHIAKGIALRNSLDLYCKDYCLSILCVEEEVYQVLSDKKWDNVKLIKLEEIEDAELLTAKANRHKWEYIWTLKPALLNYIITTNTGSEYFAEFDADTYFFSNPNEIFNEAPEACLYLTDHNNSEKFLSFYEISGKFNSGFVGCRNCITAIKAVAWWKAKAIEWCYAMLDVENKRYGDQRYLDVWPEKFSNVHVIQSAGVNAAHWNIENYQISTAGENIYLGKDKLVFYHFSGVTMHSPTEFNLSWMLHLSDDVVKYIYMPFLTALVKNTTEIQEAYPKLKIRGFQPPDSKNEFHYIKL